MHVHTYTTKDLCNTVEKGHQFHHYPLVYCCPSLHQLYCYTTCYILFDLQIESCTFLLVYDSSQFGWEWSDTVAKLPI